MKTLKIIVSLAISIGVLLFMSSPIQAEVVCETGAYGTQTCREIPKGIERVEEVHETVDAGLPVPAAMASALMISIAGASYVARRSLSI